MSGRAKRGKLNIPCILKVHAHPALCLLMPNYTIDQVSYRKDSARPLGQGYSMRKEAPSAIVIHTTNSSKKNTDFDDEAKYLRDSVAVGAHFLVGKRGEIAQILSPDLAAWHAGGRQKDGTWTAQPAFDNFHSIGIESHVSVGETWTDTQRDALTWLVRRLMAQYHIGPAMVETHRKIALPPGRKSDPESWPNEAFYAWQHALLTTPPVSLPTHTYKVIGLPIYQKQTLDGPLAGHLATGERVEVDKVYPNGGGHLQDQRGFVPMSGLEETQP